MKGLFDLLNSYDPAIRQGLLQAGVALLGSRGNFGQSLGQGLGAGLLGTQQFRDRQSQMERQKLQDQLLQGQVGQMRQQESLAQLPGRYIVPPSAPTVDATGGMETADWDPIKGGNLNNSNAGRMDLTGLVNAYMAAPGGLQTGIALQEATKKARPPLQEIDPTKSYYRLQPDGTYKMEFTGTPKAENQPSDIQQFEYALKRGEVPKGQTFTEWKRANAAAGASSNVTYSAPVPFLMPDGTVGYAQPGNRAGAPPQVLKDPATGKPYARPDDKTKDLTESQAKATTFLGQMRSASQTLKQIGADQSALSMQAETALAGGPMNAVIGQKAQRVRQSQDQWSEAFLRFKTGAAATIGEVTANRRMFFPVIGDSQQVIAQKAAMRKQAEDDMEIAAGRGVGKLPASQGGPVGANSNDPLGLR